MKTKKWLLLALCLLLALAFVPATARAEEYSGKCGDNLYWSFDSSTGRLTITGSGAMEDWRSSGSVPWNSLRDQITSISLPQGLTSISFTAFYCTNITSITIPKSVTSIALMALSGCTELTSIQLEQGNPSFVTVDGVLYSKDKTTLLCCPGGKQGVCSIPISVIWIGSNAFEDCSRLTSVTIPDSVDHIGNNAFYGCTGLTSITIPNSVTSIGNAAFFWCSGLTSITIPDGISCIRSQTFRCCKGLTSVTIPNGVTTIDDYAFDFCTGLTSVTIPNSVTTIGNHAFEACTGLTSVTIPNGVTSIGKYAFCGCEGLTSIAIPDSVTSISDCAFYGCWVLKTVKYGGTQAQKAKISIESNNEPLLNATWQHTVNVSFNANGGSCSTSAKTVTYGKAYGTLPTPTRSGYTFDGWYTAKTGGKKVTATTVCYATGDYTLYARWKAGQTYTVTLNPNGGTCGTASKQVTYGQAYGTLPVPTRKGYTFAGWWTAKTGGKKVTASTICYASGNYTLYARWTEGYTMTFNPNGGTVSPTTKVVQYGQPYGTLPTPTKAGYTFTGWWTTKAEGGKKVTSTTVCYASAGYTLYARWTPKKFVITLNPNGGECATATKTVTYGQAYGTMPVPSPRTGYTFAGWYTAKTGGKKVTATTVCYATGNYTLYARWTPKTYTVTFNPNGGSYTKSSMTVTYGKQYGALPEPTRTGYSFAGWWTTRDTGGKQVFSSTYCYATGNYTLYARWTKN